MKRLFIAVWFVSALTAAQAAEVGGVKLDDKLRLAPGGPELVLNGAGIRTRAIFKVYVAGLYLPEKKATTGEVLALAGPKRVAMTMLRDLSAQQLSEALGEGIRNNSTAAEQEALKARTDELLTIMNALGEAKRATRSCSKGRPSSSPRRCSGSSRRAAGWSVCWARALAPKPCCTGAAATSSAAGRSSVRRRRCCPAL